MPLCRRLAGFPFNRSRRPTCVDAAAGAQVLEDRIRQQQPGQLNKQAVVDGRARRRNYLRGGLGAAWGGAVAAKRAARRAGAPTSAAPSSRCPGPPRPPRTTIRAQATATSPLPPGQKARQTRLMAKQ